MKNAIFKLWDTWVGLIVAISIGVLAKPSIFSDVVTELVAFFGIQAAAILPAMVFAAGILRPEGLTLDEVRLYRKALRKQMIFWITLLILDFLVVVVLIIGKIVAWDIPLKIPRLSVDFNAARILIALISYFSIVAILRMIPFLQGIMSLLFLNGEMVEHDLIRKNAEVASEKMNPIEDKAFKTPEGFGHIVDDK